MQTKLFSRTRLGAMGLALVAGVMLAPIASAQDQPRREGRAQRGQRMDPTQRMERKVAFLTERLTLTTQQQQQLRTILGEERQQMEGFRGKRDSVSRDSVFGQIRAIRQRTEQRIEGVLTGSQRSRYQQLREEQRKHHDGRRERGGRRGRPADSRS
jgi:hypothetical protein